MVAWTRLQPALEERKVYAIDDWFATGGSTMSWPDAGTPVPAS
jgi:hypothetical protein